METTTAATGIQASVQDRVNGSQTDTLQSVKPFKSDFCSQTAELVGWTNKPVDGAKLTQQPR